MNELCDVTGSAGYLLYPYLSFLLAYVRKGQTGPVTQFPDLAQLGPASIFNLKVDLFIERVGGDRRHATRNAQNSYQKVPSVCNQHIRNNNNSFFYFHCIYIMKLISIKTIQ